MSKRKSKRSRRNQQHPKAQQRIPTIAIIGPSTSQESLIEEMCGGIAKLKFVDADQSQPAIPSADAVFLLTNLISYRWVDAANEQFAKNRIYMISGGITGLAHRINAKAAKIFLLNAKARQKAFCG